LEEEEEVLRRKFFEIFAKNGTSELYAKPFSHPCQPEPSDDKATAIMKLTSGDTRTWG
jgi:hypothetical protein